MTSARGATTGIAGAAAVIAVVTVVSRVVGFGRWVAQDRAVGTGCVGNIYAAANQLPNVLYEVVAGGALAAAVVPVLAPMIATGRTADVQRTVGALLGWALLVMAPVTAALVLLARPLADWLTPHGCAAARPAAAVGLTAWLLRVLAVQVMLYAVGTVASSALQAHRRFLAPSVAPLLSSLVVIVSYVMVGATIDGHHDDPSGLPGAARSWLGWGTTLGVAALSVPLLWPLVRAVRVVRPGLRFPPGVARAVTAQAAGGVAALAAQQGFTLTVLALTRRAGAPVGSLNLFQYAQAVYLLPFAVLVVPLATSTFPALSQARADPARFAGLSARTLRVTLGVAAVGAVALTAAAPALEVFFGRLDGAGRGAPGLGQAVVLMALGLPGFAVVTAASRSLQAWRRPRRAAAGTALAWVTAAAVAGAAVAAGVRPLAAVSLGSAVGMTAGASHLVAGLRREAGAAVTEGLVRLVVLVVPAAAASAVLGRFGCVALLPAHASWGVAVVVGAVAAAGAAGVVAGIVLLVEPGLIRPLRRGGER